MNRHTADVAAQLHADNLLSIANAVDYTELREMKRDILNDNDLIDYMTRAVMTSLIGSEWLDEGTVANNYSEIRGFVKDAIMNSIMREDLQELAQIETACRNWRRPESRAASVSPAPTYAPLTPRQEHFKKILNGLVTAFDVFDTNGVDPLETLEDFIQTEKAKRAAAKQDAS